MDEKRPIPVAPFDTYREHPRYENVPGVEYILEDGRLLRFCQEAGCYQSADRLADGTPAVPAYFRPVYAGEAQLQPDHFIEVENPLLAAELTMEQNANQLDGVINNLPPERPRVQQGYTVLESATAVSVEVVLAHNPKAPQPFVTWRRNQGDGPTDFYWGHYFSSEQEARKDFAKRVGELAQGRPSLRSQLREKQAEVSRQPPARGGKDAGREL